MNAFWIVERTQDARFPFRISIEQNGRALLTVRAQSAWPGAGTQVFCLRETERDPAETLVPHERVPLAHLDRIGRKLALTLDRAQRKRCEFLKIERPFKNKPGTYEQIFLRTEAAARAHKSSARTELGAHDGLDVVVDSTERYAWKFPAARVVRRKLPVGDYALLRDERPVAIAERKTLENFLGDLAELKGLHQQLSELAAYPHAALVLEFQYADLGNPAKLARWSAAHVQRVVAELAVLFPRVQPIFAGNRKLANLWTQRWFATVAAALAQPVPQSVREPLARYEASAADGGLDARIRVAALIELPDSFEVALLRKRVTDASPARIKRVLDQLRAEGRLVTHGRGRGTRWVRAG
jgi:hypothetical protein